MAARPRYSVGTRIRLLEPASDGAAGEFAIVSRHFLDTSEPSYRIRSLSDRHERSVGEGDIEAVSLIEGGPGSKIVPLIVLRPGFGR